MNFISVESSNLSAVGYDPDTQELQVQFKNGGIYSYEGVPHQTHADLVSAESIGSAFHKLIKSGPYPFKKVN